MAGTRGISPVPPMPAASLLSEIVEIRKPRGNASALNVPKPSRAAPLTGSEEFWMALLVDSVLKKQV